MGRAERRKRWHERQKAKKILGLDEKEDRLTEEQKTKAIDKLKKLEGLPPYDGGGNIVRGDGYFARSIEEEFGMPLHELSRVCGFDKVQQSWEQHREMFLLGGI